MKSPSMKSELICGDVLATLRSREELQDSVDVIVTSPPYNLGKKYGEGVSDKRKPAEYLDWVDDWSRLLKLVLKPEGSFFLNIGGTPRDPTLPLRVLGVLTSHWKVQNSILWVKSIALPAKGGEHTFGHFKPINSPCYLNGCHEFIFHLTHTGRVPIDRKAAGVGTTYSDKSNLKRWKHAGGGDMRCRGDVWFIPYQTIRSGDSQRPHPATFPVELAERCIRLHGVERAGHVLDPFLGIGSSLLAADRCGVPRFTGIDVNADYVGVASRRHLEENPLQ